MITPEYAAGFFDGEGCVNITIAGRNKQAVLRVMITNTNIEILQAFQLTFGGKISKPKQIKDNWKHTIMWVVRGIAAIEFLMQIRPYARLKLPQINIALEFWDFMKSNILERCDIVHSPSIKAPWHIHLIRKKETIEKEYEYKNKMHFLNAKGL